MQSRTECPFPPMLSTGPRAGRVDRTCVRGHTRAQPQQLLLFSNIGTVRRDRPDKRPSLAALVIGIADTIFGLIASDRIGSHHIASHVWPRSSRDWRGLFDPRETEFATAPHCVLQLNSRWQLFSPSPNNDNQTNTPTNEEERGTGEY